MNKAINTYIQSIKNKKIAIIGMGVSNEPLIEFLYTKDSDITIFDKRSQKDLQEKIDQFEKYNLKYSLGNNYLDSLKGFDLIFKSPGVHKDIPELLKERDNDAIITSEMELFFDLCPGKIIAVTGSDGKTTTTSIIYKIIKKAGHKCFLGGNIGNSLIGELDNIDEDTIIVLELSSFQLHTLKKSPSISIITNLSPNHLDMHKSYEEYIDAKKNIFKYQQSSNKLILNYDNIITNKFTSETKSEVIYFSRLHKIYSGAMLDGDQLIFKSKDGITTNMIKTDEISLKGVHNVENILAAIAATQHLASRDVIFDVVRHFKSIEHRIEFVKKISGISFYNDSIGSSPSRTIASIKSFEQKVILIAGGYDKKISYESMGKIIKENVSQLYLIGQTAKLIENSYLDEIKNSGEESSVPISHCETLEDATIQAFNNANEGDIILMSPASASFDMFRNFDIRGKVFKEVVNSLVPKN